MSTSSGHCEPMEAQYVELADHVQPLKEGGERFGWQNLQPLCVSCHNRKTARETAAKRYTP